MNFDPSELHSDMIYLGLEKGVGVECRMILCVPVAGVLLVIYPGLGTGAADGR